MKFVSVRELRNSTNKVIELTAKEEVIIASHGKPRALLTRMSEEDLEDYFLAKHLGLERDYELALQDLKQDRLISAPLAMKKLRKKNPPR